MSQIKIGKANIVDVLPNQVLPQAFSSTARNNSPLLLLEQVVTLAQINAGITLLGGITGNTIYVSDVVIIVNGTFLTGTTVDLKDNSGSPKTVFNYAVAQLTDGSLLASNSTGVTHFSGYTSGLTADAGLQVTKSGSNFTGGTDITFKIAYKITSP